MVDCSLCYTAFGSGSVYSEAHAFRGCGHVFCRGCIAQLKQIGCPACRWKPSSEYDAYASNLSIGVVLRLFIDFSETNTLQTKLEDTEKKLAAAQFEMDRSKEEAGMETDRLQRKWKAEMDSLKAELEQASRDVEYLTRRLENKKLRSAKDAAALVSEGVKTTWRTVGFILWRADGFVSCAAGFVSRVVDIVLALGFVLVLGFVCLASMARWVTGA